MRKLYALAALLVAASPAVATAQAAPASPNVDLKEWKVEWGGRTRDPYVAPDGTVFFVSQTGNYIASLAPTTGAMKRFDIPEGTNPHNLIVGTDGMVWFSGNANGTLGKLDPKTGQSKIYTMPSATAGGEPIRDPHTLVFDGKGNIWWTAQAASRVGRFNIATEKFDVIDPAPGRRANPYGIVIDKDGRPWFNLFATNLIGTVNPQTLQVKTFPVGQDNSRTRRIAMTDDGMIWYVDYPRGYLGRMDPRTGAFKEWLTPGGASSLPYAVMNDDQGRLWVAETGATKQLVGFDPKTERFFAKTPVSGGIRHMMFDRKTGTMWFGTDASQVGRIVTRTLIP
jgi:virginiamycin B lyase